MTRFYVTPSGWSSHSREIDRSPFAWSPFVPFPITCEVTLIQLSFQYVIIHLYLSWSDQSLTYHAYTCMHKLNNNQLWRHCATVSCFALNRIRITHSKRHKSPYHHMILSNHDLLICINDCFHITFHSSNYKIYLNSGF